MTTLAELMTEVRALRDALHARLDDDVTDRVFRQLRLRHLTAVLQARREVEDTGLPPKSAKYAGPAEAVAAATASVGAAASTDEPAMLAAIAEAKAALDLVVALP